MNKPKRKQKLRKGTDWLHPPFGVSPYAQLHDYCNATGADKKSGEAGLAAKLGIPYRTLCKLLNREVDAIDLCLVKKIDNLHKETFGETVPADLRPFINVHDKFRLKNPSIDRPEILGELKDVIRTCRAALEKFASSEHPYTAAYACYEIGNLYADEAAADPLVEIDCVKKAETWWKKALVLMPNDGKRRSIKVTNALHFSRISPMFNAADKETRRTNPVFVKQFKAWRPTAEKLAELCAKDDYAWRNLLLINSVLKDKSGCVKAYDGLVKARREYNDLNYVGCAKESILKDRDFTFFVKEVYPEIEQRNSERSIKNEKNSNGGLSWNGTLNSYITGSLGYRSQAGR
jgi:hypothetical protein